MGEIVAGSYLPTERELQAGFGASRATVRKALAALIEAGWAFNVPNKGVVATRGLKPGQNANVAFIHSGTYVLQLLSARIAELLEPSGLNLVHMGGRVDYPMEYALQRALDNNFRGALVWSYRGFPDAEQIGQAMRRLPIVALDHRIGGPETDLVTFDHEQAAYDATEHLARLGCTRIGVTGMLDMLEMTHQRFRGYMRAMFANGLQPQARDFAFTFTSGLDEHDTHLLEYRLRAEDRPDGFLVLQDISVPAVVETASRVGLKLPDDLKLATIGDDLDLTVGNVGMTAVALDWEALAQQSVALLLERLDNLHRPPQVRYAPHHLMVRGLCGARREDWTAEVDKSRSARGEVPLARSQYVYSTSSWTPGLGVQPSRSGEIQS